ncbi:MAG: prolipoprotein diacylglyceryl transferase [Bacteroidetes bacterium]|nr:prolipoprotein diacylglyceryl transferase [Bacteroidota bacterium]
MHTLIYIHWSPDPDIFSLFGRGIRWYGLLFSLAFIVSHYYMRWVYARERKLQADLDRLTLWIIAATVIGARLGHCLFYDFAYYSQHPLEILYIWEGGLASHGAAIGILTAMFLFARRHPGQSFLWLLDRLSMVVCLSGALIRLGNLMNSEIYGLPTTLPWGFYFEADAVPQADRLAPRHPTQIYEILSVLLIFGILHWLYKRKSASWPVGRLGGIFLILLFSARILVEFFKENQEHYSTGLPLNTGQLLSIPFILTGVYLLLRKGAPSSAKASR